MHASIPQLLALASRHLEQGAPAQAEALFRQILAVRPEEPNALYGLAVVAMMAGAHADAARLLRAALKKAPRAAHWWFVLGEALRQLGDTAEAARAYEKATRLDPSNATAWNNLGAACQALERHEEAVRAFRRAVDLAPRSATYLINLSGALHKTGDYEEAIDIARRAVRLAPQDPAALTNLGASCLLAGRFAEAEEAFRSALGLLDVPETRDNLAEAQRCQGKYEEAEKTLEPVMARAPTAHSFRILAKCLKARRSFTAAEALLRRAVERFPDDREIWAALVGNLGDQGRVAEAMALTDTLRDRWNDPGWNAGGVVFWCNAVEVEPERSLREARAAAQSYGPPPARPPRPASPRGRKLRLAYLSPDFRRHSVAFFFEGLLREHDRSRFEITCLQANELSDEVTERLRSFGDTWHPVSKWTDEDIARRVRRDRIDILVDLAGYTAGNRLGVLARRPAPVQVTYLGYPGTTGLASVDYRLTDGWCDPEGQTDAWHSERLWRLPRVFLAYGPPAEAPEPAPPAGDRPPVFGSFNAIHKLSDRLLRLWARLLAAVPEARLFLKTGAFADDAVKAAWLGRLESLGIPAGRIVLAPWARTTAEHLALYGGVDVALDTFPYHGTTTTCEALWMGVPVVTLAGRTHAARVGVSLLSAVGLPELIARSEDEYVAIAAALAQDRARLAGLRSTLRARMAASPLCDAQGLARAIEAAYEAMVEEAVRRR